MAGRLVARAAALPGGLAWLILSVDGRPVADLSLRTCETCGIGVIEHVRVDPPWRRRGLACRLLTAALAGRESLRWSTTEVADSAAARGFWAGPAAVGVETDAVCRCAHMAEADSRSP